MKDGRRNFLMRVHSMSENGKAIVPRAAVARAMGSECGLTLMELLLAMAMGAILVTLIFGFFNIQAKSFSGSRGTSEMQQELRWAVQFVSDRMKLTGNGVPTASGQPAIQNVNGASGAPDSVNVLGSFTSAVILTSLAMAGEDSQIPCGATVGIRPGDLAVISDGTFSEMFMVTDIQADRLIHEASPPWNDDDSLDHAYAAGSTVTPLCQYSFYIAEDAEGHPNLMVKTQSEPPQILAGDTDQFQVRFKMKDDSWQDTASEVYDIREIEISLRSRSPEPIQGYRDAVFGDGYKRLAMKTIVIPKNLMIF
jgi:hypothetical protein